MKYYGYAVLFGILLVAGKCGIEIIKNDSAAYTLLTRIQTLGLPGDAYLISEESEVGNFGPTGNHIEVLAYRIFTFSGDSDDIRRYFGDLVRDDGFSENTTFRDINLGVVSFSDTLKFPVPYPLIEFRLHIPENDRFKTYAVYSRVRYSDAKWDARGM